MDTIARRLLLAGSTGPERAAARLDVDDPRWFEPLHVRDPAAARERIAGQIAVGADVIVAPTWQTHRRALLPVGETRRARAWTVAAADIARQAMDEGLERRELIAQEAATPGEHHEEPGAVHAVRDRPIPMVAGVLPRLDDEATVQTGRLATADVAQERDYRDQAGLLADAAVDVILIEDLRTVSSTRAAIEAVTATGRLAWVAAPAALAPSDPEAASLRRWVETCVDAGADRLLAPVPRRPATAEAIADIVAPLASAQRTWGAQLHPEGSEEATADDGIISTWLEQGASIVARLDIATPAALRPLRDAVDRFEAEAIRQASRRQDRWHSFVEEAARAATGGEALWIGETGGGGRPDGFAWTSVRPEEVRHLPLERYRLIVATVDVQPVATLVPLLEAGGMVVLDRGDAPLAIDGLRMVRIDDADHPALAQLRRED